MSSEETTVTEESARCTFCGDPEKPIPTAADLKDKPQQIVSLLIRCWDAAM